MRDTRRRSGEFRHVALNEVVVSELPSLGQHHDGHGRESLRQRGDIRRVCQQRAGLVRCGRDRVAVDDRIRLRHQHATGELTILVQLRQHPANRLGLILSWLGLLRGQRGSEVRHNAHENDV